MSSFHSATLIFAGILLQGTAVAAFYVRSFGGTPAVVLSIVVGFAGVLAIAVALGSHAVRSRIRTFINENFFSYKYDYRLEWTKFIQALSQYQEQGAPERALRTLADLLDSPGGVLWVRRRGWSQFLPLASWSFGATFGPIDGDDAILPAFEDETVAYLELASGRGHGHARPMAREISRRLAFGPASFPGRADRLCAAQKSAGGAAAGLGGPQSYRPDRHAARPLPRSRADRAGTCGFAAIDGIQQSRGICLA